MIVGRDAQVAAVASALDRPGLTVVAGLPGSGKTTVARAAAARLRLPVREAGALATLSHVPGLPLSRAIRAALPTDDVHLAVEAVRARVGGAILLLDDAQWCDRLTLSVLPALVGSTRIVATVRTPSPQAEAVLNRLRELATTWLELPALDTAAAVEIVRAARPELAGVADHDPAITGIVQRAGGNPLALRVLASARRPDVDALHGIASLVAELPQDERTALAALGLLARPASPRLLGQGAAGLRERGLAQAEGRLLAPTERFVAEVAAGVLPDQLRRDMHRRLADLVGDDAEAARHLAAAGDNPAAAQRALRAGRRTTAVSARAELLLFALARDPNGLSGSERFEIAQAALDAGLPGAAAEALADVGAERPADSLRRAVLRAEAAVTRGATAESDPVVAAELAESAAAARDKSTEPTWRARHAIAQIRLTVPVDPGAAAALAEPLVAELGEGRAAAGLRAAYAEVLLALGDPRWEPELRAALAALDPAAERPTDEPADPARFAAAAQVAAVLSDGLREECRTEAAGEAAREWAERAASAGAYSWEVVFRARQLWSRLHGGTDADSVVREGTTLLERSAPAAARTVLVPTVALAYADGGAIPAARQLLAAHAGAASGRLARWVSAETAWLHGDPNTALTEAAGLAGPPHLDSEVDGDELAAFDDEPAQDLAAALASLTAAWTTRQADDLPADPRRPPVTATLQAVRDREITEFVDAAKAWDGIMLREAVRCLLAAAELDGTERALPWLQDAERRAEAAGLALLLGRVRRVLRQHGVVRRDRSAGSAVSAEGLSPRELEAIRLVGHGHSTRRIAELLGITRNTAETYVKSAMGKLGARTRTEAAVLAADLIQQPPVNSG